MVCAVRGLLQRRDTTCMYLALSREILCCNSLLSVHNADCDACRWVCPTSFGRVNEQSAVVAQPTSAEGRRSALHALISCPTFSIHVERAVRIACIKLMNVCPGHLTFHTAVALSIARCQMTRHRLITPVAASPYSCPLARALAYA